MRIPDVCRYCGGKIIKTSTHQIYEKSHEPIYLCTNCNAYVSCDKRTGKPLGKVANSALRMKRRETHVIFDGFWHRQGWSRSKAYKWLALSMHLPERDAHIGNFEMDECEQVIRLCRSWKQQSNKECA